MATSYQTLTTSKMNIYSIHQIPNMPSLLPGQAVPICKLHHTPCDFFSVSHLCALPLSIKVPPFPCQTLKHFFFSVLVSVLHYYSSLSIFTTHSSTLAWKIPWTEEPGRLQSMGLRRVGHDWATSLSLFTFMHCRRKWQPTPMFLSGESQGQGRPGGLPSMGSHRVGHDWSDLAAAAAAAASIFKA